MARGKTFCILFALIIMAGVFLRFYDLSVRPIHHDDGVASFFRLNIYNGCFKNPERVLTDYETYKTACSSAYAYDPEYHGPFSFFFGAFFFLLLGINDYTLRAPGCLFSVATICLLPLLRKELGDLGTLAAAALLAVSPSMVFYSQFVYHDNYFIFFTLLGLICAVRYLKYKGNVWLYLGAADTAVLLSIKETFFVPILSVALFLLLLFAIEKKRRRAIRSVFSGIHYKPAVLSLIIFIALYAFFYSNMFTNTDSLLNASGGIAFWLNRSTTWTGHIKPFDYYFNLFIKYEPAILLISISALFVLKTTFSRWCAWWAISTFLIYSYIPYKTPWLDVNMLLPMSLLAGSGVQSLAKGRGGWKKYMAAAAIIALIGYSAYTAWNVSYVIPASKENQLAYVGSLNDYDLLVSDIVNHSGLLENNSNRISILALDPWPLPWSLRGYNLSYRGAPATTAVVISDKSDYSDIAPNIRDRYEAPKRYEVREWTYFYVYYRNR